MLKWEHEQHDFMPEMQAMVKLGNLQIFLWFVTQDGQRNKSLYTGASVTSGECLLLVLSYMVRHSLTKEALTDLLVLLNVLLPHVIPVTQYKFFKAVKTGNSQVNY